MTARVIGAVPAPSGSDWVTPASWRYPGSAYTGWRQRLRHTRAKRRWAPHGFQPESPEFGPFLAIYNVLVARFGLAANERFAAVLQHHEGGGSGTMRRTAPAHGPRRR